MKRFFYILIILFAFVGCGGGGSSTQDTSSSKSSSRSDDKIPSENFSGTSFNMWDYVVPDTTPGSNSVTSRSLDSTYNANFRSLDKVTVVETPEGTSDEKVIYKQSDDKITVTFKKNNRPTFSYEIKKSVQLQEQTTVQESACMLVNHFTSKIVNGTQYNDVIEIDCGKHKGFYAKGKGEIAQE